MINSLIKIVEKSGLYNDFVKNLPYPFNDLYFGTAVLLITVCLIILYAVSGIRAGIIRKRIRKRQEEARIHRLEEEEKDKNDRDELMKLMRENTENSKSKNEENQTDSMHDKTTGLLNKLAYNKMLSQIQITDFLVIFTDVNNLKKTNDQYGKAYGDKIIKAIADELRENFPDKSYRTGGDEFIVLISGMSEKIAKKRIEKIKSNLNALTESDEDGIVYSAAFGVATSDGILTKQEIIELAEEKMKQDKAKTKCELREKYGDDGYLDERIVDYSDDDKEKDIMTGCKTRESFEEKIRTVDETNLSIIFADIDGLKLINDKINHHSGDTVIKGFAKILMKYFMGCVYRLSDDDFCVITKNESKESLLKKINDVKADMISLTEESEDGVFYSASFGISTNAGDGDKLIDRMLDECQINMRKDKEDYRSGKRSGVVVSDSVNIRKQKNISSVECEGNKKIDEIIEEKRSEAEYESEEEKDALMKLLYSMKEKEEEGELEAEKDREKRLSKEKREEILNEEIRAKYNKEDMTGKKANKNKQRRENELALKSELEKIIREEKKKKGLFSKRGSGGTEGQGTGTITGNTVDDVDIL